MMCTEAFQKASVVPKLEPPHPYYGSFPTQRVSNSGSFFVSSGTVISYRSFPKSFHTRKCIMHAESHVAFEKRFCTSYL